MGVARKMVKVKEDLVNLLNDCNTELEKKKAEQVDVLRDIPEAIRGIKGGFTTVSGLGVSTYSSTFNKFATETEVE